VSRVIVAGLLLWIHHGHPTDQTTRGTTARKRQDKTRQRETRQDLTKEDKTRQGKILSRQPQDKATTRQDNHKTRQPQNKTTFGHLKRRRIQKKIMGVYKMRYFWNRRTKDKNSSA
jgi:hypothetical protein